MCFIAEQRLTTVTKAAIQVNMSDCSWCTAELTPCKYRKHAAGTTPPPNIYSRNLAGVLSLISGVPPPLTSPFRPPFCRGAIIARGTGSTDGARIAYVSQVWIDDQARDVQEHIALGHREAMAEECSDAGTALAKTPAASSPMARSNSLTENFSSLRCGSSRLCSLECPRNCGVIDKSMVTTLRKPQNAHLQPIVSMFTDTFCWYRK